MASMSPAPGHRAFARLVRRPDTEIDLVRSALLVARDVYPDLDPGACLAQLDALAAQVQGWVAAQGGTPGNEPEAALPTLLALNHVLFAEAGFHGNSDDYYDPRNSYLNDVLTRRTGISITLALVYIEVARRVGLRLHGVGLPGHFLVGYTPPGSRGERIFVDPFAGGTLRSATECADLFRRMYGGAYAFSPQLLAPVTARQFLARLLNNLKSIYLEQHDWRQALRIVDYLLLVQPHVLEDLRLRGLLYYRLGAFVPALSDLRHYLHAMPDAPDATQVRYQIELVHNLLLATN
jgi:regulator of sirC expression with transglutaminase-like and TPR domain